MTQLPSVASTPVRDQAFGSQSALNDLDLDTFLELMITELQNQDPLNPLENDQLLAQISQIREVGATDRLTQTLESVLLGQNISSATNLLGNEVEALSDDNERVRGVVHRVAIQDGEPKLFLALNTKASPSTAEGEIEAGDYRYRVVWSDENENLFGLDLPPDGEDPIVTFGEPNRDQSIRLSNLPISDTPKQIYRTDATGTGDFRLVATLTDGATNSYVDTTPDDQRAGSLLREGAAFQRVQPVRSFTASLKNVAEIRPPDDGASGG